jgi:hypothetical protein
MMRYIFLLQFFICFNSCCAQKAIKQNSSTENIDFKNHFFECIDNVESYTLRKKNKDSIEVGLTLFKQSLSSISQYIKVDYSLLANYEFRYSNYEIFKEEKGRWINWYEQNKYKDLKWK